MLAKLLNKRIEDLTLPELLSEIDDMVTQYYFTFGDVIEKAESEHPPSQRAAALAVATKGYLELKYAIRRARELTEQS